MSEPDANRAATASSAGTAPCPCGGLAYAACCGPLHAGAAPGDALALMRARYSAYVLGREDYLRATWHGSTRPAHIACGPAAHMRWLGLAVLRHEATGADTAIVEFVARYKEGGRAHRLHEVSRFVREGGRWLYVTGEFPR